MILFKIYFHILAFFKKQFLRMIYWKRISFGKNTTFRRNFTVTIEEKGSIHIGRNCFFNNDCTLSAKGKIVIGDNSIFGENVKFYDHNHRFSSDEPIKRQGYSVGEIYIGDRCWIGSNVNFLKGARVGNHCVIGAGCVIDREIPDEMLVTANRQLFFEAIAGNENGVSNEKGN